MNLVFDFGAVLFNWQLQTLLRQYFPAVANTNESAMALVKDFFHHPDQRPVPVSWTNCAVCVVQWLSTRCFNRYFPLKRRSVAWYWR